MRRVRGQFIARQLCERTFAIAPARETESSLTAELRYNATFCVAVLTY